MSYQTQRELDTFRQATGVQDMSPINGVAGNYRFLCPECKQSKPMKGRKSRGWRNGFRCLECAMAKSAA